MQFHFLPPPPPPMTAAAISVLLIQVLGKMALLYVPPCRQFIVINTASAKHLTLANCMLQGHARDGYCCPNIFTEFFVIMDSHHKRQPKYSFSGQFPPAHIYKLTQLGLS